MTSATGQTERSGFTLLELVLVMLIITTVLGGAAVSLRGFFVSRKAEETAVRIVSLARYARSMAVSEGRTYRLVFDGHGRSFYLVARENGEFRRLRTGLGRSFSVPDEVTLELLLEDAWSGRNYISFHPDGLTEPAAVRLTDLKGGVVEVRCASPTELFAISSPEEPL